MPHQRPDCLSRRATTVLIALILTLSSLVVATPGQAAQGEARALLERAAATMIDLQSFHFKLTTPRGKSLITEQVELAGIEGDVQRPDRFRAAVTARIGFITLTVHVIGVGTRLWVTDPTQREETYIEVTTTDGQPVPLPDLLNPDRLIRAAVDLVQEPRITGNDKIDGVQTTCVEGMFDPSEVEVNGTPVPELSGRESIPLKIWIDDAGHIVRIQFHGPLTAIEEGNVIRRLDLSRFNEPIAIEPPDDV